MTDLRKAAEMALEAMLDIPMAERPKAQVKAIQALRQALAQEEKPPVKTYCGGKPNYCTPEVTPEVTGEVTGDVDAINISAERVDETAKREHEEKNT